MGKSILAKSLLASAIGAVLLAIVPVQAADEQHPDLNGGSAEAFVQLSYARDILMDPRSRAEYDAERHAAPGPGAYAAVLKRTPACEGSR